MEGFNEQALAEKIVSKWEKTSEIDGVEIFFSKTRSLQATAENNKIKDCQESTESGFGIRIVTKGRGGFAYASGTNLELLEGTAERAYKIAKSTPKVEGLAIGGGGGVTYEQQAIFDPELDQMQPDQIISRTEEILQTAQNVDSRVVVDNILLRSSSSCDGIVSSSGLSFSFRSTANLPLIFCAANEGDKIGSFVEKYRLSTHNDIDISELATDGASLAVDGLKALKCEEFTGSVILTGHALSSILAWPISFSVCALNVQKQRSPFQDKLNEEVAAEILTVRDSPNLEHSLSAFPIDGEGNPTQEKAIIEKGVLKTFVHTQTTANRAQVSATGNATRLDALSFKLRSYNVPPTMPFPIVLTIPRTRKSLEDLTAEVQKGLLVHRFSGNVVPETGDFSGLVKQAYYVQNGEIKYPIKGTMISGNIYKALRGVIAVGGDLETPMGYTGVYHLPSLLFPPLSIKSQ